VTASKRLGLLVIPVLFAVFPLLSLFAQNQTEVELRTLWWPLALCVIAGLGAFGLALLAYRDAAKAAVLASVLVIAFFYYGAVAGWGPAGWWYVLLWAVISVVVVVTLARTTRDAWSVTVVLAVAAVVLVAGPTIRIVTYQVRHPVLSATDPRIWPRSLASPPAQDRSRLPDIFVLVPDDYPRPDVLRQYFHHTDTTFLDALRRRGFAIAPDERSPYSDSESNIAAEVNMDYLTGLPKILGSKSQDVRPVRRLIADNRAARLLEPLGYRYVHLDTDEVTFPTGNPDISSAAVPDSLENLWLQKTVLRVFGGPRASSGLDGPTRPEPHKQTGLPSPANVVRRQAGRGTARRGSLFCEVKEEEAAGRRGTRTKKTPPPSRAFPRAPHEPSNPRARSLSPPSGIIHEP